MINKLNDNLKKLGLGLKEQKQSLTPILLQSKYLWSVEELKKLPEREKREAFLKSKTTIELWKFAKSINTGMKIYDPTRELRECEDLVKSSKIRKDREKDIRNHVISILDALMLKYEQTVPYNAQCLDAIRIDMVRSVLH